VQRQVKIRRLPIGLSKTLGAVNALGPELGQHTELILTETLGYSWEDVARFKEQGGIL
jgi:crotonobetainyl-CoA:carnitine CoA-transferase CaiB-like acyl-CoA transferase